MVMYYWFVFMFMFFVMVYFVGVVVVVVLLYMVEEWVVFVEVDVMFVVVLVCDQFGMFCYLWFSGNVMVLLYQLDGQVVICNVVFVVYVDVMLGLECYVECMYDLQVWVYGDIVVVWGCYSFVVDGKVVYCGYQQFDLVCEVGVWKIQNVTWLVECIGCEG